MEKAADCRESYMVHETGYLKWPEGASQVSLVVKTEKAMAPHSSTLAWKIQWTEESGRLQSMGSLGVRQD